MAPNGRVNPNCPNVSNPFHECTEACLHKTKTKTKQTKPQTNTNKKTSGYRRSVTDGDLGKKVNEKRRTYAGCAKASNPYHQCDDNCHKTLLNSGAAPVTFDSKKKLASKPEPPVVDSVPASKIGAIYLSDGSSPISNASENKEVEPHSSEQIPIEPLSGEKQVPHVKPVYYHEDKNQLNQEDKVAASHEIEVVVPITNVDDTREQEEGLTSSAGGSADSSSSRISQGQGNEEDSDNGETEPVMSESRIVVGGYHVKESFGPILRSILDRYGDIGASCHLESVVMRSYYVECVCFVVQELQSNSMMHLDMSKLEELLAILKDVESAKLRVAWLRSALDEIAENIEVIHQHKDVKVAKANSDREVESLREELESKLETLAQTEQEVADIKTRIPEIRDRLSELELKSSELDKSMLSIKSMVDDLHSKSLIDELL